MYKKPKHRTNYTSPYRKKSPKKDENILDNPIAVWVLVVGILYLLFTLLFWLWIIGSIVAIFYGIHYLNNRFWWYNTRYYFAPILSYLTGAFIIIVISTFVLVQYWKIDAQIFSLAKSGSDYITIGNKPKHGPNIEIDEKGIATKITTTQIEDLNLKEAIEMPSTMTEKIVDSIREWFLNIFK